MTALPFRALSRKSRSDTTQVMNDARDVQGTYDNASRGDRLHGQACLKATVRGSRSTLRQKPIQRAPERGRTVPLEPAAMAEDDPLRVPLQETGGGCRGLLAPHADDQA
jgi:hypothetical protein